MKNTPQAEQTKELQALPAFATLFQASPSKNLNCIPHLLLISAQHSIQVKITHIHMTCKFARHYGKDCENEVHVNLDFRIRPINALCMHAFDDFRNGGRR